MGALQKLFMPVMAVGLAAALPFNAHAADATTNAPAATKTSITAPANTNAPTATTTTSVQDFAFYKAFDYTKNNKGVAIIISQGTKSKLAPEKTAQTYQEMLKGYTIDSQYFIDTTIKADATSVTFVIKDVSYGPYTVMKAARGVHEVAQHFKGAYYEPAKTASTPVSTPVFATLVADK